MHVGITNPQWRGKRSRHLRRNFTYLARGPWYHRGTCCIFSASVVCRSYFLQTAFSQQQEDKAISFVSTKNNARTARCLLRNWSLEQSTQVLQMEHLLRLPWVGYRRTEQWSITNALGPGVVYIRQWTGSPLDQVMACTCHLFGAKPLFELLLIYCKPNSEFN